MSHSPPSPNRPNGRDEKGRFAAGNPGGPGNPNARKVAAIRFRGYARNKDVEKHTSELLETLSREGIQVKSTPIIMRYNAPYTPGFMRRNEVAVEIEL